MIYLRNSCLILIMVSSVLAFMKYGIASIHAPAVILYLSFEIFSTTWGMYMGMKKRFISSWKLLKIMKGL